MLRHQIRVPIPYFLGLIARVDARSWLDILAGSQLIRPLDSAGQRYMDTVDSFAPPSPSLARPIPLPPSLASAFTKPTPVVQPSRVPTESGGPKPQRKPTGLHTESPGTVVTETRHPITEPTAPSSPKPTVKRDPYPPNPPPSDPDPWYFNYDTTFGSPYGPGELGLISTGESFVVGVKNNHWGAVTSPPDSYWKEFSDQGFGPWKNVLSTYDPLHNMCAEGLMQSPIDVRENGAKCYEHHQVRTRAGRFQLNDEKVTKLIESNKLRIVYPRRPCSDFSNATCSQPLPPNADFPLGWPSSVDVIHIDFKVPSEHLILTKRFDAEMQIYSLHPTRRRLPTVVSLINAAKDGYNALFEEMLAAFRFEFIRNQAYCAGGLRHRRRKVTHVHRLLAVNVSSAHHDYETWADFSTELDEPKFEKRAEATDRRLRARWDPFDKTLIPSVYFYRYDGSLTEPPCGEWVTWFITDTPMNISLAQLESLKRYVFLNVDKNCRRTSVQFAHSVARPIRPWNDRPVWHCTAANFAPDTGIVT